MRRATTTLLITGLLGVAACGPRTLEARLSADDLCAERHDAEPPGSLSVTGQATLEVMPDVADIAMTLTAQASAPDDAVATLQRRRARLVKALSEAELGDDAVRASTLSLVPRQEWDGRQSRVVGYEASLVLTASTCEFDQVAEVMEAGAEAGVTTIRTRFRSTQMQDLKDKVRTMALEAAMAKAQSTAEVVGVTLARVVEVTETPSGPGWNGWGYDNAVANAYEASAPGAAPLSPEAQPLTLTVSMRYEI